MIPYRPGKSEPITLLGFKKYLLIEGANTARTFHVALYVAALPTVRPNLQQWMSWYQAPAFLTTFTGVVALKDLATGRETVRRYQDGVLDPTSSARSATPNAKIPPTARASAATAEAGCQDYLMFCFWKSVCDEFGFPRDIETSTLGTAAECNFPMDLGCGLDKSWERTSTETHYYCATPTFDERIDDTQLAPCLVTVLNDIKGLSSGRIAGIVQQFAGQTPGYDWKLQNGSLPAGTNGATASYDRTAKSVTTTFDAKHFTQASDLSVARTVMHEAVHAYLVTYFANDPINANKAYPDLVMAWAKATSTDPNPTHHDDMVRGWVQELGYGLQQYGVSKGYNLSTDFYIHMAWGGLENTSTFQSFPAAVQQQIRDVIVTELTGQDSSGNPRTRKGKLAGC